MNKQAASELRLKPGRLRRHEKSGVGHREQLGNRGGTHGKSHCHIFRHTALQLAESPDAAHKVDALIGSWILDTQNRRKKIFLQDGNVQALHRIRRMEFFMGGEQIPAL